MRGPSSLLPIVVMVLASMVAASARSQEPRPATLDAQSLASREGVQLTYAWRFHPGDDPRFVDPGFDDTGWEPVEPALAPGKLPAGGWPGVGTFRRHLHIEPSLWGRPLEISCQKAGAAEIFLDGVLLGGGGGAPGQQAPLLSLARIGPFPLVFSARPEHVLAVRYSCAPPGAAGALAAVGGDLGFTVTLADTEGVREARAAVERRNSIMLGALVTVLVFVALLHMAFYTFYPRARENLLFSLYLAVFAGIVARDLLSELPVTLPGADLVNRLLSPTPPLAILLGLLTYYSVRTARFPGRWKVFTVAAVTLMPVVALAPEPYATLAWTGYWLFMIGEVVRVERSGATVAREGAAILLVGMAILAACVTLQVLINLRLLPPIAGVRQVYVFGVLASVVSMSLFLARSFARTSLHLERRLAEVETLSAQILEQERTAHARELQARLLEAENARKSRELEAGRALQLSMLPQVLPEVAGLEVAVAMATASEVGGDYYDFRMEPDGSLLLAMGDATGHGVAAGIVVTAAKALFGALGSHESLAARLGECNRVLGGMQLGHLHMCLTLARVTPTSVTVCSAGMPPVLIRRAVDGTVEELGSGGLPLGGRLTPKYEEQTAPLFPGDTLLLASDGFAELLNPDNEMLGHDGVSGALRSASGSTAGEVVGQLTAVAERWRRDREQADDLTLVVARVARQP